MTLLGKYPNYILRKLYDDALDSIALPEKMIELFGRPPYYFDAYSPVPVPKYKDFVATMRDDEGREYMLVEDDKLGVKFPIRLNRDKSMTMPVEGATYKLTEIGGGNHMYIRVIANSYGNNTDSTRVSTGWILFECMSSTFGRQVAPTIDMF